MFEAVLYV